MTAARVAGEDRGCRPEVLDYEAFLRRKAQLAPSSGVEIEDDEINPLAKPHQRDGIRWSARGGCRALFYAFGLGKSIMQIELLRLITQAAGGRGLIVAPLGVRQEFMRDAKTLATGEHPAVTTEQRRALEAWQDGRPERIPELRFIRRIEEADDTGLYITNYETVRDGKLDPRLFTAASLDEASVLRGFGGTKTFREFMTLFAGDDRSGVLSEGVRYRFVATATPSPNEYIELLSYAAFLGIMDVGQAKTRFFRRNSEKADHLTLHPHKEREFWMWVASWALFVQKPSDLGYSDEGYALPPIEVRWHEVPSDHSTAPPERDGQSRLFRNAAIGVQHAAREKRDSLPERLAKMMEVLEADPGEHFLLWHDLEDERRAIEASVPGAVSVYGSQNLEDRERAIIDFSDGRHQYLAAKPVIAGSGCNFQRHCHRAVFLGIGFKFNDLIQAIHRIHRFLQPRPVVVDLIYSEAERAVRQRLEEKWRRHEDLMRTMTAIIREYGLSAAAMEGVLARTIGVDRQEITGDGYRVIHNDCVLETAVMPDASVGLILTSIPFASQYEYTPSYNDFGHSVDNGKFWAQMDYLTPELLRVLQPGRICAIHVKDRITPGGINGLGFQTVDPLHCQAIAHYRRHGFAYLGMKTVVTDVVRENNQTYRLGWTEQCKDGSRMGCGMPEYVLLFRRPPTDRSNGYADLPVVKDKVDYPRARWQLDAHGFARSSGDRLLAPEDLVGLPAKIIYRLFRRHSAENIYDFEHHIRCGEALEAAQQLPPTFMLLPPHSWHPDVWTDVARMRTLNSSQAAKGREMHLCPLQFDIVERLITQCSMPGEVVYDPFAGLMTVPYCAVRLDRQGWGCDLNSTYFADGAVYLEAAAQGRLAPTLFDLVDAEQGEELEAVS